MLSLVRCRLSGMIVAQAMIALLVRNENSADGRPLCAFLPASTAIMRPLAPAGVTSTRGAHAWGASGSREAIQFGLNPACPSNSLLRLRQMGKPCGKTLRWGAVPLLLILLYIRYVTSRLRLVAAYYCCRCSCFAHRFQPYFTYNPRNDIDLNLCAYMLTLAS